MNSKDRKTNFFDDDFEVTYEDDPLFHYEEPEEKSSGSDFQTIPLNQDETIVMSSVQPDSYYSQPKQDSWEEEYYDNYHTRGRRRKSSYSGPGISDILSPIQSTAKYGSKAIYKIARSILRLISLLLILATVGYLTVNFWKGSAPYGDPATAIAEQNYCLGAYAAIAAFFLLFEFFSFLWALTRVRVRDGRKIYKEDTGRGLFSFIFIYVCSYAAFWLNRIIPQSPEILRGIQGGLKVFGSMHNALFGLCLAGIISCLIRKYTY